MKALSKFALFTALVVLSACSVAEAPFKVYGDKEKSFKQMEKFFAAGKFTKWENEFVRTETDTDGKEYEVKSYSRIYTYDKGDNLATANFYSDPENEQFDSSYQTYTHKKLSVESWTAYHVAYEIGGPVTNNIDITGYTIYELTVGVGGSASTPKPKAAAKQYRLIKIEGGNLSELQQLDVDAAAKTISFNSSGEPTPTVYKKL